VTYIAETILPLVAVAALLIWLSERADRHDEAESEDVEAAAKTKANMPPGHPEKLTALLPPTQEWDCGQWDRELDPEAAE
jgi:hypothetical protein